MIAAIFGKLFGGTGNREESVAKRFNDSSVLNRPQKNFCLGPRRQVRLCTVKTDPKIAADEVINRPRIS